MMLDDYNTWLVHNVVTVGTTLDEPKQTGWPVVDRIE